MAIIERDGCKRVDDETLCVMRNWWDDHDIVCDGFSHRDYFTGAEGDCFVAVTYDGRLLDENDVCDMADAQLRENYPDPVQIAHLEFDVAYALAKFAPDAYEEYVSEEVDRLVDNDKLRRLWR